MNGIENNEFSLNWERLGAEIPTPKAVLCISAHWYTKGTAVTAMEHPQTIHDFYGFPKALFDVQYPAPGDPSLAQETVRLIKNTTVHLDHEWGLDHGTWSVVKRMYPEARIPVLQLSIDGTRGAEWHYELAKELSSLRQKGILIIGSGNMVHNLGLVAWDRLNEVHAFDWAQDASDRMKRAITTGDHKPLIEFHKQGPAFDLAINSSEHFLPLLYALALQGKDERTVLFNDKALAGSLTMTSVLITKA